MSRMPLPDVQFCRQDTELRRSLSCCTSHRYGNSGCTSWSQGVEIGKAVMLAEMNDQLLASDEQVCETNVKHCQLHAEAPRCQGGVPDPAGGQQ